MLRDVLKNKTRQANEISSKFQKGAYYRDGVKTDQGWELKAHFMN